MAVVSENEGSVREGSRRGIITLKDTIVVDRAAAVAAAAALGAKNLKHKVGRSLADKLEFVPVRRRQRQRRDGRHSGQAGKGRQAATPWSGQGGLMMSGWMIWMGRVSGEDGNVNCVWHGLARSACTQCSFRLHCGACSV